MSRRPYGPGAWLVDDLTDPAAWSDALRAMDVPGIGEIIPAESTVVVRCARERHDDIGHVLDRVVPASRDERSAEPLTIDVVYDGPDLAALANAAQISIADIVRLHVAGSYSVAFCGFSPGFGYLRGVDRRLHVPRRDAPRTSVPAGSVGVAAGYTCVYPAASPGGWHLIGHTAAAMWDADRHPPALLRPGQSVRFRQVPA